MLVSAPKRVKVPAGQVVGMMRRHTGAFGVTMFSVMPDLPDGMPNMPESPR